MKLSSVVSKGTRASIAMKTSISSGILVAVLFLSALLYFSHLQESMFDEMLKQNSKEVKRTLKGLENTERQLLVEHLNFNSNLLGKIVVPLLYNLDMTTLGLNLMSFMEIEEIKAIVVTETGLEKPSMSVWKENDVAQQGEGQLPEGYLLDSYKEIQVPLDQDGEVLGSLSLYFSDQDLLNRIATMRKEMLLSDEEKRIKLKKKMAQVQLLQGVVMVVIVLILILSLVALLRIMVIRSLNRITDMVKDIAEGEGDLTKKLPEGSGDEIGVLSSWFNTFVDNLRHVIEGLIEQTGELSAISHEFNANMIEIDNTVQNVSGRISESNASITSTTSAIDQMRNNISKISEQIEQSNLHFEQIMERANEGNQAVKDSIETMVKITESSAKTISAISIITSISNQTNLLSLNAAIEAAKAGDAGKGFSVVAEEIRRLAESTHQASNEIQEVNRISTQNVEEGTQIIHTAGNSLEKITSGVGELGAILSALKAASEEMAVGIEQIVTSTGEVLELSNNNTMSMVEISSSVKESVHTVSLVAESIDHISTKISQFKVE